MNDQVQLNMILHLLIGCPQGCENFDRPSLRELSNIKFQRIGQIIGDVYCRNLWHDQEIGFGIYVDFLVKKSGVYVLFLLEI